MDAWAIVVAAGRGERLAAGRPKALVSLHGRTLLEWALRACEASRAVTGTVVVGPADALEACREIAGVAGSRRPVLVVAGGAERQDSVQAGLAALPEGFDGVVLVHDAARPLADGALFDRVAAAAAAHGAAVPVVPLVDTIKRVRDGRVQGSVDRAELCAAQTPQGFRRAVIERAYAEARAAGARLTDEAMAVERSGGVVVAVDGEAGNRKMTTPDDLLWAEGMLARGAPS